MKNGNKYLVILFRVRFMFTLNAKRVRECLYVTYNLQPKTQNRKPKLSTQSTIDLADLKDALL